MTTITPNEAAAQAAAQSVARRVPWLDISTITNDHKDTTSLPLLQAGGLDWTVTVRSLYRHMNDGSDVKSLDFEVVRDDTEAQIGSVRKRYTPCFNRSGFAFGDEIVKSGDGMWIAAGEQYGGSRVFMVMQLADEFNILGDPHRMYVFFRLSHDGSTAIRADCVPFRLKSFGQNHLVLGNARSSWKVLHVSTLEARLAEAQKTLSMAVAYRDAYVEFATKLADVKLPFAKGAAIVQKMIKQGRSRRDDVISDLMWNWQNSQTIPDEWRETGLGLLNATTEYFGHIARRQGDGNSLYESVMTGEAAKAREILARELKVSISSAE